VFSSFFFFLKSSGHDINKQKKEPTTCTKKENRKSTCFKIRYTNKKYQREKQGDIYICFVFIT
jgi:hypothetical protein